MVAQRVKEAFEAEGGNAHEYGVLCYDEWPAEPATYAVTQYGNIVRKSTGEVVARDVPEGDGSPYTARDSDVHWIFEREETVLDQPARPAGSRYGIRYEEALVLECAYLRSKLNP